MPNVVVIGASAGGIAGLLEIVRRLPGSFAAPVLIVVHVGQSRSVLPRLLTRAGELPAAYAEDGEPIRAGRIYVAPPDYHMTVRNGRITLSHGPRENHTRPAIDPLFRTAASTYGSQTIGVILSGALSDGTAGLMAIKGRGGTVIVQDPSEALITSMPLNAIEAVDVDYVLPAVDIAATLHTLVTISDHGQERRTTMSDVHEQTRSLIREDMAEQALDQRAGQLTLFTCPDCGGSLWQTGSDTLLGFECHVGHTWGWDALVGEKSEQLETALWASVRLLVERATLNRQVAARSRHTHSEEIAARFEEAATRDQEHADLLRTLLDALPAPGLLAASGESDKR